MREGKNLTAWPTVYLVAFVNLDENEEIGANEFARIVLEFGKCKEDVAGEGIEPPTRGFSVLCSTN